MTTEFVELNEGYLLIDQWDVLLVMFTPEETMELEDEAGKPAGTLRILPEWHIQHYSRIGSSPAKAYKDMVN